MRCQPPQAFGITLRVDPSASLLNDEPVGDRPAVIRVVDGKVDLADLIAIVGNRDLLPEGRFMRANLEEIVVHDGCGIGDFIVTLHNFSCCEHRPLTTSVFSQARGGRSRRRG